MDETIEQQARRHRDATAQQLRSHRDALQKLLADVPPDSVLATQLRRHCGEIDDVLSKALRDNGPVEALMGDEPSIMRDTPSMGSPRHRAKMRVEVSVNIGMMRTLPEVELSIDAMAATDADWHAAMAAATVLSEAAHQLAEDATIAANAEKVAEDAEE